METINWNLLTFAAIGSVAGALLGSWLMHQKLDAEQDRHRSLRHSSEDGVGVNMSAPLYCEENEEGITRPVSDASKSVPELARLIEESREYACIYMLAKQRQKGCDGMGELATRKEEFRDVVDKVIQYCKEKKYISEIVPYDIDAIADEIKRL